MRIVVDLQGAQSTGSRHRGIGRYTTALAEAMARNSRGHDIVIALNGSFPSSIEDIRATFDPLVGSNNIHVWYPPPNVSFLDGSHWRRSAAEPIREAFIQSLDPDIVHVTSLFEGSGDDTITSIKRFSETVLTSVTLYDLIPLLYQEIYLVRPDIRAWYESKIEQLKSADLLLAISEASRQDAIRHLGFAPHSVCNISGAINSKFRPLIVSDADRSRLRDQLRLTKPFVLYTGGIDHRKNIEGLIDAYSTLPPSLRHQYQLAIVCSIPPGERVRLECICVERGLQDDVIFTGYVSEEDLLLLYNICTAFVFPSWYEGFGLPVLEAMACGAPVIASNCSSIPEIVGHAEALFDARSRESIAKKLAEVLTNERFRHNLRSYGLTRAATFSWEKCARVALEKFEHIVAEGCNSQKRQRQTERRPLLAFVSPVPPDKSGIADYSADLLPSLATHYDIHVISDTKSSDQWIVENCTVRDPATFDKNAGIYDRILYQFGNSEFHTHMFDLLQRHPGVIVLHDFFLSGILSHSEWLDPSSKNWRVALYESHGYAAIKDRYASENIKKVIDHYPSNLGVIRSALGVISHSTHSQDLARKWLGDDTMSAWARTNLPRKAPIEGDRAAAREALGIPPSVFVVCSFGGIHHTKDSHRLVGSWTKSMLAERDQDCQLVFVGENRDPLYTALLEGATNVEITGYVDEETYRLWLLAADVAVQLRHGSRGETSAAALDAMNYGLATIVNGHGSLSELPMGTVFMLPENYTDNELAQALCYLWSNSEQRTQIGARAAAHIQNDHRPSKVAEAYFDAIEAFYGKGKGRQYQLVRRVANEEPVPSSPADTICVAEAIARTFPPVPRIRQLLIDVTALVNGEGSDAEIMALERLLLGPADGSRVEPIHLDPSGRFRYARAFVFNLLGCPGAILADDLIEYFAGDRLIASNRSADRIESKLSDLKIAGVTISIVPELGTALVGRSAKDPDLVG